MILQNNHIVKNVKMTENLVSNNVCMLYAFKGE